MKAIHVAGILAVLGVGVGFGFAGESASDRYAGVEEGERVRIVDSQGVETEATGFGKLFALPAITAFRGDSEIHVPYSLIRLLRTGEVADNRLPVHLTLVSGREMDVVLDRTEYEAIYGGRAEFGYFRIPLEDIRTLEFVRVARRGAGLGQRCESGHLWYNDTWRFCPFDGKELTPLPGETSEDATSR